MEIIIKCTKEERDELRSDCLTYIEDVGLSDDEFDNIDICRTITEVIDGNIEINGYSMKIEITN